MLEPGFLLAYDRYVSSMRLLQRRVNFSTLQQVVYRYESQLFPLTQSNALPCYVRGRFSAAGTGVSNQGRRWGQTTDDHDGFENLLSAVHRRRDKKTTMVLMLWSLRCNICLRVRMWHTVVHHETAIKRNEGLLWWHLDFDPVG